MIRELKEKADVLLIVPPFGQVEVQSLAVHTLQAIGEKYGYTIKIFYANMHLASHLGSDYNIFCQMNYFLLGERMFARAAWGDRVSNKIKDNIYDFKTIYNRDKNPVQFFPALKEISVDNLKKIENKVYNWTESLKEELKELPFSYIGVTSSFEQNNASVAILKRIKADNPEIKTFIGGFNCEDEIAHGIRSLDPQAKYIDYIFSGESEHTFIDFLNNGKKGIYPKKNIIQGSPLKNMDELPILNYSEYFIQLKKYLPQLAERKEDLNLSMETSRGCWWGEKNQCLFCGTAERICYREKGTEKILEELKEAEKWGIDYLHMADLIMPHRHFKELLPKLVENEKKWTIYYEQKVSLNPDEMDLLKNSGVIDIQPGLETLSTKLLKEMKKGTTFKQNLKFLRNATAAELKLYWNILWGIPGEKNEEYKRMNHLFQLIQHMVPPVGIFYTTLVKFSPHFKEPEKYNIKNVQPLPSYYEVYPAETLVNKIAVLYTCQIDSETFIDQSDINKMISIVEEWNFKWESILNRPRLQISKLGDDSFILLDTRGIDGNRVHTQLSKEQISVLLDSDEYKADPIQKWAIKIKAAIVEDNELISLVTIDSKLRKELAN